jgi:glycosyltransferase involved in cell wall biosynthesis
MYHFIAAAFCLDGDIINMNEFDIVFFGNDWFGENKTSSHHIAQRLARSHKVLYVECPGLRMPKSNIRDFKKIAAKIEKIISKPRKIDEQFWVYTLFQIPLHRFAWIRRLNEKLILFSLKMVMRQVGFIEPLLWFHIPHLFMVPGKLPAKGVVYYCIDNYSALPDVNRDAVQAMDDEMTRKADLVFAVSEPVFNSKKLLAKDLILSPHGVDFDHFNKANKLSQGIPDEVANISSPIIGFWGLIENRIDLDLVAYIAQQHPTWSFVLIGYVEDKHNSCVGIENVHFLGPRKFSELPDFASVFDVTILPYRMDDFFYNCNPLKLREYLATGKPVVTLRNPEVEKYSDLVCIADDYDDFSRKIAWCLDNDTSVMAERRISRMRSESWDQRVENILDVINTKFKER